VTDESADGSTHYILLTKLADEFAARYRAGQRPSVQEYIDRYPDLADEIRELLPAMVEIEQVRDDQQQPAEPAEAPSDPAIRQLGDYRIIREIGHGGMGVVYEAEQVSLGRHVALKVLPLQALKDANRKRRFEREARAAAKLHHTNIVPVFGVGEHEGLPYYVMQYIQGQGLDAVLDELNHIRPDAAASPFASQRPPTGHSAPAVQLAHSLLTGEFPQSDDAMGDEGTAQAVTWSPGASREEEQSGRPDDENATLATSSAATDAPNPGQRPESFNRSASSLSLPGTNGAVSGRKTAAKKHAYWQRVASIGRQVANALDYAHQQGILHRDVKPSNLILDLRGSIWVTDFGLAKVAGPGADNLTHSGDILGTLRYMPPEAFERRSDARSDVYSLGLTLYELLAMRPAFDEKEPKKLIKRVTFGEPTPLDQVKREIPRDLVTIVQKAIAKEPARRYATAEELAADLERFIEDEPIVARRQTELERCVRWARHHPGIAALGAALTAVLVVVTIASVIVAGHMSSLASEAEQKAADEQLARVKAVDAQKREAEERANAEQAERLARAAEEQGRKLLYTTDMQLAPFVWKDDRSTAEHLRLLLAKHIPEERMKHEGRRMKGENTAAEGSDSSFILHPSSFQRTKPDLRGFEWHYYQHLLQGSAAVFSGHGVPVEAVAFAADGQLVTLDQEGRVRRWDVDSQHEEAASRRDLPGGPGAQPRVLSPDGRLAALAEGETVHVFDTSTGREAFSIHSAHVDSRRLIFSRDGDKLVVVDSRIRWCSTRSGVEIASLDQGPDGFNSVALSADGLTLAVAGLSFLGQSFSTFRLDPTGKRVTPLAKDAGGGGTKVASALSPDGQLIALSYFGGSVGFFDTATGRQVGAHGLAHPAMILAMAFSDDGARLATADAQGTIKIWEDPRKLTYESAALRTLKGHRGAVTIIRFSRDGKRLVSAGADRTARVWDLENPDPAVRRLERFRGPLNLVARFSPDGQLIAASPGSGLGGDTLCLWDAATGRRLRDLWAIDDGSGDIYSVAFSPADRRLLAAGWGRLHGSYISLWDIESRRELARLPAAKSLPNPDQFVFTGAVGALAFSPDGRYLVAGFGERHITTKERSPFPLEVWEVATRRLTQVLKGHSGYCTSLAFSKDGTLLASGSRDGTAMIWSTRGWKAIQSLQNSDRRTGDVDELADRIGVEPTFVECVAFAPDGRTLAMASQGTTVQLWDVASGKLKTRLEGHASAVRAVVFSPDGRTLASGGTDRTVRLWNVEMGRELMQLDPGNVRLGQVESLDFSPDGTQLLAAGSNAAVWSAKPIVRSDADRAAEKARRLAEFARRLAADGQVPLAKAQLQKAQALYERVLEAEPENDAVAAELAQLLSDREDNEGRNRWVVLEPSEMKSKGGATLSRLPDESVLAGGKNPLGDAYTIVARTPRIPVSAIRLEALTHESLPNRGPGRSEPTNGTFAVVDFQFTAHIPGSQPRPIEVSRVAADHHFLELSATHWNIEGGAGRSHTAVYLARQPVDCKDGTRLEVQMAFSPSAEWPFQNLGRFRLSVSSDPAASVREQARLTAMKLRDPWAKLAVAYALNGRDDEATRYFTRALERSEGREARKPIVELGARFPDLLPALVKQLEASGLRGDLYAAVGDWERAIVAYRKLVADRPEDGALLSRLATAYQSAGRTREAVPFLAKASSVDPNDALLSLKLAALQAWFGQDQELAATRQRILAFANGTTDALTAERAARACSIRASVDQAELDATLALARKGVELGKGGPWREWSLLALGMAEYRSGHDAAAIEALLAAVKTAPDNAFVACLSGFYRAMSLFRQGKPDEAREVAIAAASKMVPLPKDEDNPMAGTVNHEDVIQWLAYKEARALIRFDAGTSPKAETDRN
jgi:WD40 repeat protein/serine/threonine protein kinase/tetratricopeptide (TPR) repeat protein